MQSETYLDLFILIWVHLTRLVHGCIRFSRGATSTRLAPSLIPPPPPPRLPSSRDASLSKCGRREHCIFILTAVG